MSGMPGGTSNARDADAETQSILDQVKSQAEEKAGKSFSQFVAKQVATQVVAGTNFFVKADIGNGEQVHVRIFRSLPPAQALSVHSIQTGKTASDPLVHF
ncbi:hypothetical protein CAOG_01453 [Capsaspora owczarzaki ATCC 30864]|uniref:Cystatin domain-containing protein n=1 Tax=Capsaspora owczarzaki (strain ATCC 30864) TaxID=595528 RepID=A0A0D2VJI1_CAPO3|nr:hypothetical protein CAOG_01453 [Capsaspora owczarzaki ATCC 30864]KJE90102.1 hypothetical protein CAOG_001453 [Capsaspora owczarzaki ATCC 30864]|eukprot:XP_004364321.1 hypothetical protein CAOG_01453 [Capsaspora owczarzaki ATCC 30864]